MILRSSIGRQETGSPPQDPGFLEPSSIGSSDASAKTSDLPTSFSPTTNRTNLHESEAAAPSVFLSCSIRVHSCHSWFNKSVVPDSRSPSILRFLVGHPKGGLPRQTSKFRSPLRVTLRTSCKSCSSCRRPSALPPPTGARGARTGFTGLTGFEDGNS